MKIEGYYTSAEAAKELGVTTVRRVQQLIGYFDAKVVHIGRAILIPAAEVERMKARDRKPGRKKDEG